MAQKRDVIKNKFFNINHVLPFLNNVFKTDIHVKRIKSMANATLGVMTSASLSIHIIGMGLAQARGLLTKHAIKQVDRLLSNKGINVWMYFEYWVPLVIGVRKEIVVALDWTEFDKDGHSTIALYLVTSHGRATPLLWKSHEKSSLKNRRDQYEDELLVRFKEVLPNDVKVILLADRGFGDHKLFEFLVEELGFDYVIRIKGNIYVESDKGEVRAAQNWVGKGGRARTLRNAKITAHRYGVPTVMCVHEKNMKESWCIVSSKGNQTAKYYKKLYARRWGIETGFRDTKDLRFGMGMHWTHIKSVERRDRLFLINAFAIVLLTLLGAAGEKLGMDKHLKANTAKYRTHSLFRQGCMHYDLMPNMPEERLNPLMDCFVGLLHEQPALREVFSYV